MRRLFFKIFIALFAAFLASMFIAQSTALAKENLVKAGDKIVVAGKVTTRKEWGPPNFDENPATDSIGQIFVLQLKHKVKVAWGWRYYEKHSKNGCDTIKEIQLFGDYEVLRKYINKEVTITGTIEEPTAPGEYLDYSLWIDGITPIKN